MKDWRKLKTDRKQILQLQVPRVSNLRLLIIKSYQIYKTHAIIIFTAIKTIQPDKKKLSKPTRIIPLKSFRDRINFEKVISFPNAFLKNLENKSDEVQQYEDDRLQYYGRKMIPLATLMNRAIQNMRGIQKQQKDSAKAKGIKDPCFEDWLLVELTKWFNEQFFTWVNTLPCKICNYCDTRPTSSIVENDVRVEVN